VYDEVEATESMMSEIKLMKIIISNVRVARKKSIDEDACRPQTKGMVVLP